MENICAIIACNGFNHGKNIPFQYREISFAILNRNTKDVLYIDTVHFAPNFSNRILTRKFGQRWTLTKKFLVHNVHGMSFAPHPFYERDALSQDFVEEQIKLWFAALNLRYHGNDIVVAYKGSGPEKRLIETYGFKSLNLEQIECPTASALITRFYCQPTTACSAAVHYKLNAFKPDCYRIACCANKCWLYAQFLRTVVYLK